MCMRSQPNHNHISNDILNLLFKLFIYYEIEKQNSFKFIYFIATLYCAYRKILSTIKQHQKITYIT